MESYHTRLVSDVCDVIMQALLVADPVGALMLACTCKVERVRYTRLAIEKLYYRELYLEQCSGEEMFQIGPRDCDWVLRGEKGYAHAKKEQDAAYTKMWRQEFLKPMWRTNRERARRDGKYVKEQWKKRDYDVQ